MQTLVRKAKSFFCVCIKNKKYTVSEKFERELKAI